ncbi:CoF synthetase [Octadecabacter sp. G9-8]|uniref:CoF synthetase n=1 Tax=Octadecabacter dasysiphoniae TaxID=2909341 RepID=A0ABS9CU33_9RHOB|nr:F390 synthetase-related protein [Octadecabacter dasysiphoniae]MCF2870673.1 CoF synthetase [Octadecabacter dasysiphoniae]
MIGPIEAIQSFVITRWRSRAGQSRGGFERWQNRAVRTWLKKRLPKVGFYKIADGQLSDLPVNDKATLMAHFDQFNTHGLTADAAWEVLKSGGQHGDLTVGASTGTSGNRGLFVVSEREKHRWLGAIVAKTMADLMWKPQRVAIILPQDTGLYGNANRLSFIKLRTFSVLEPPQDWRADLEQFDPTVIVAPPKMLRYFAQHNYAIRPVRVFSAAETLDRVDEWIANAFFDHPIRQIYMATEGLLAVSCAHGTLHLAEDSVAFEYESLGDGLVSPLITSFRRDTQIMARYRMNDVLRLSDTPCPCGSPLQPVAEIVGRMDDVFVFDGAVQITPDVMRNAVLDADRMITDFRLIQMSNDRVVLRLPPSVTSQTAQKACHAVQALLERFRTSAQVVLEQIDLPLQTNQKLRRVERRVSKDG